MDGHRDILEVSGAIDKIPEGVVAGITYDQPGDVFGSVERSASCPIAMSHLNSRVIFQIESLGGVLRARILMVMATSTWLQRLIPLPLFIV